LGYSYKELVVWKKSKDLAVQFCRVSKKFPRDEIYGLTSQMRRSIVSVRSNIAEGQGRLTKGEFLQSLGYAGGSLLEFQTQLVVAVELNYLLTAVYQSLEVASEEVLRMINGLIESLRGKSRAAGV
jgi:four helix bundle protein